MEVKSTLREVEAINQPKRNKATTSQKIYKQPLNQDYEEFTH